MTDKQFQDFKTAYVAALLWSTSLDDGTYFDDIAQGIDDFTPEAVARVEADCQSFVTQAGELIPEEHYSQAGHDFALTRNEHGAGFWDRATTYGGQDKADKLTKLAHTFKEINLYTNDGTTVGME